MRRTPRAFDVRLRDPLGLLLREAGDPLPPADGVQGPMVPARPLRASAPVERPSWHERLDAALPTGRGIVATALPVLEYHVDCSRVLDGVSLLIHVGARLREQNGELGVARPITLSRHVVAKLPLADQWLLAARERQEGERVRADGLDADREMLHPNVPLSVPWRVASIDAPAVLPWLAATGRVFLAGPRGIEAPAPLHVDAGPAFVFEVTLATAGTAEARARVHGQFRRGDEAIRLDDLGGIVALAEHDCVLIGDRLVHVDCAGALGLVADLTSNGPLDVPRTQLPAALARLAALPGAPRFLTAALQDLPCEPPVGVVSFTWPKSSLAPLEGVLAFQYGGAVVDGDDEGPFVHDGGRIVQRDLAAEARLREVVAASGLQGHGDAFRCERASLPAIVGALVRAGVRVLAAGKRLRPWYGGVVSVTSGIDWFDLGGDVAFDGFATTVPELLRRKLLPEGFVELGDGSYGMLPETWLRRLKALRSLGGDDEAGARRLRSSQALLLDALLAAAGDDDVTVDLHFAALRARLASFARVEPALEPRGFAGELRPYQRAGLGWLRFLRDFGLGGCLADDMGLGKTVQVLAHLLGEHGSVQEHRDPSLLVAPRSVLGNWLTEARRFAPALRVLDFSQPDRWRTSWRDLPRADLVLTTYGLVRTDAPRFTEQERRFHYVILDEAQMVKNAGSQAAKAVRLLRGAHRLVMTGTPVENHLGELWSLCEFLNPGMLGRLPAFAALFGGDVDTKALIANRELVQRTLRPVLLRRTKAQVLTDLPAKIEQTLWCELQPQQRRRYDELREHYRQRLLLGNEHFDDGERFIVLTALLRLRQAACHEGLLDPTRHDAPSAKLDELLPRLQELVAGGHKALVFSQFTSLLDLIEPALHARGIVFERLDGSTRDRAARVARFQQDATCRVFLISLKAGGFGLNLTAASYVFVCDPWWNPAVEMQAIDRAHRIGQQRTVHAYRLVCRGTVEEHVLQLQGHKKALCEAILGNERSLLQDLTRADLELLLG